MLSIIVSTILYYPLIPCSACNPPLNLDGMVVSICSVKRREDEEYREKANARTLLQKEEEEVM
jgi:hypothetical protein